MDVRGRRKRLVPRWLLPAVAATIVVLALGAAAAWLTYLSTLVSVPDLVGRTEAVARESAALTGLEMIVETERFSADVPKGAVISQSPLPDERVKAGSVVEVVLSSGTEYVPMPDLVGLSLKEATDKLSALGIGATTQDVVSPAPAGTVIETFPAPGVQVRTGETVRLSVAIGGPTGDSLLPFDLTGLVVGIDPEPADAGMTMDVALDVSRRLRSLLEASGATVVVTRSITASAPPEAERVSVLTSTTPDVCVGLSLGTGEAPGLTPVVVDLSSAALRTRAEEIAARFMTAVRTSERPVNAMRTASDPVLGKVLAPSMRLLLGDPESTDDASHLRDPEWADSVARAIYRALGETFE